jgi:hypothetical protein
VDRRETVIKLSNAIERLRAQVREAEDALEKRRLQLREAEEQLDRLLGTPAPQASVLMPTRQDAIELLRSAQGMGSGAAGTVTISSTNANPKMFYSWDMFNDEKPITAILRGFFSANPRHSFGIQEVMDLCRIPKERDGTVRQALKRMFDEGYLLRERDGVYTLNITKVHG